MRRPSKRARVGAAWLMGEGPERAALLAEARALRPEVDPPPLPILLPALALGGIGAWRKRCLLVGGADGRI